MLKEICAVFLYSLGTLLAFLGSGLELLGCMGALIGLPLFLGGNALRRMSGRLIGQQVEDIGPKMPQ
jgi:hypothetical protein